MANFEREPISSILVLKVVGILALISLLLAIPLIWLPQAKKAVERLAQLEAEREEQEPVAQDSEQEPPAPAKTQPNAPLENPNRREALVTRQRAVPFGYKNDKGQPASEWPDASRFAVRHTNLSVEVKVDDLRAEEDQLLIKLNVTNLSPAAQIHFRGWDYATVHSLPAMDWPRLANIKGQELKLEEARAAKNEKVARILSPGDTTSTWLAFQGTPIEALRLELPASAFQGAGALRLEIPRGMVVLKTASSVGARVLPDLIQLVKSSDDETRIQAASALGGLGIEAAPAVSHLAPMLTHPDPLVRIAGLEALGKIGSPSRPALREILANVGNSNTLVAKEALRTLDKLRPLSAKDLPALHTALQDANPETRRFAIETIVGLGSEGTAAAPALTSALADMDSAVRAAAALGLGKIGPPSSSTISSLDKALQDRDGAVRKNAVTALGQLRAVEGAKASLIRALSDEDSDVFATAAAELSVKDRLSRKDVPDLVEILKAPKPQTRAFAAMALGRLGGDSHEAIQALGGLLKDSDVQVRREAAKALARAGDKAWISLAALIQALDDRDPTVQEPVIEALGHVGVLARGAIPKLVKARKNPKLHNAANQALIQIAKADVGPLIKALQNAEGIQERHELIDLLGKIGAEDAIPTLSDLAANANLPSTRAAAAKALEQIRNGGKSK
jgi:HEAT repeat protein